MFKSGLILIATYLITINQAFKLNEYTDTIKVFLSDNKYENDFQNHLEKFLAIDPNYFNYKPNYKFECRIEKSKPATSVHRLRPSDIKVISAMGDSLTASLGAKAKTVIGLLSENREISWSIGGEANLDSVITLPNIIRQYNPELVGFSTETTLILLAKTGSGLNAAVSGQEANHMVDQARTLVTRMKAAKNINYENDWKLVTLFIGGNDLCDFCKDLELHSPKNYSEDIIEALDLLHREMPRTFVNLVSVLNVAQVEELNEGLVCSALHKSTCPCAAFPKSSDERILLAEYFKGYGDLADQLVASGRYDTRDDFTVVYQPFFKDFQAPRLPNGDIDLSYFAPDCFHFASKSQAMAAVGLWNGMLQPVGKKVSTFTVGEAIECPTEEHPYFFTYKNSE